jgi:hypothetical protein
MITLNQQIEEVEYELDMRRKVYPNLKQPQATKDYHMQRMQGVLGTLKWLQKWEPQIRHVVETAQEEPGSKEADDEA